MLILKKFRGAVNRKLLSSPRKRGSRCGFTLTPAFAGAGSAGMMTAVLASVMILSSRPGQAGETRTACQLDESYNGPHQEAFQKLRFYIPNLLSTTQLELASDMGLDYQEGFRYPFTIGFVDEPLSGSEYALAYVQLSRGDGGFRQRMNINLEAYSRRPFNFDKVFRHEMSHAILSDAVGGDVFAKLPVWLIEGLAIWVAEQGEQLTRAEAHRYPAYAEKILVSDLEGPRRANLYPQYFLAIEYIVKTKGVGSLQNLLHDLVNERPLREAMAYNLGEDWETFQKNVRDFSIQYIRNLGTGSPLEREQPY